MQILKFRFTLNNLFQEECVEFNYKWLTEELEVDPDEITFIGT